MARKFERYLEIVLHGLLTEHFDLFFRSIELQQRMIYTFGESFCAKLRSLVYSSSERQILFCSTDYAEPFLLGITCRHPAIYLSLLFLIRLVGTNHLY